MKSPHHFFPSASLSFPSAEGMNAGGYGTLLMNCEQPQGEYGVTIAFLRLITTLVKVNSSQMETCGIDFLPAATVVILSAGRTIVLKLW